MFSRLFRRRSLTQSDPTSTPESPPRPEWASELADGLKKLTRAQKKSAIDLQDRLEHQSRACEQIDNRVLELVARQSGFADEALIALADAMDTLERVAHEQHDNPGLTEGLKLVVGKLGRVLETSGVSRFATRNIEPDGERFWVVGTEASDEIDPGKITRVVVSALEKDQRTLREGRVLIAQ